MPQVTPLFAVPLASATLDGAEALNPRLRRLFLEREASGQHANQDAYQVSSKALFESSFGLFETQDPDISRLRDFCWAQLYQMIGEVNGYDRDTLQRLHIASESWFHITRRGGNFGVHNHPMHSWSGVYCVCQESDDPASDSGRFEIINPHVMNTMYMDMAMFKLKSPYGMSNPSLRLQPGQLLIFPSWLLHQVSPFEPHQDGALRITVAFNARFRLEGYRPGQRL